MTASLVKGLQHLQACYLHTPPLNNTYQPTHSLTAHASKQCFPPHTTLPAYLPGRGELPLHEPQTQLHCQSVILSLHRHTAHTAVSSLTGQRSPVPHYHTYLHGLKDYQDDSMSLVRRKLRTLDTAPPTRAVGWLQGGRGGRSRGGPSPLLLQEPAQMKDLRAHNKFLKIQLGKGSTAPPCREPCTRRERSRARL